jgi:Kef-type K+ transport system membrane component KefB
VVNVVLPYETLNTVLIMVAGMFAACIACEWLKDDMKYLYQGALLLAISAMSLIFGWALFSDTINYADLGTVHYEPLGWVLIFFGAASFVIFIFVWLPKIVEPYNIALPRFPKPRVEPMHPQQTGLHPQYARRPPGGK